MSHLEPQAHACTRLYFKHCWAFAAIRPLDANIEFFEQALSAHLSMCTSDPPVSAPDTCGGGSFQPL